MGRKTNNNPGGRDGFLVARDLSLFLPRPAPAPPVLTLEDRREWHPERQNRPFAGSPRSATRPVARQRRGSFFPSQTKAILTFAQPQNVSVCVRRGRRRQVLFAQHKVGHGKRGNIPRRRNAASSFSCR